MHHTHHPCTIRTALRAASLYVQPFGPRITHMIRTGLRPITPIMRRTSVFSTKKIPPMAGFRRKKYPLWSSFGAPNPGILRNIGYFQRILPRIMGCVSLKMSSFCHKNSTFYQIFQQLCHKMSIFSTNYGPCIYQNRENSLIFRTFYPQMGIILRIFSVY